MDSRPSIREFPGVPSLPLCLRREVRWLLAALLFVPFTLSGQGLERYAPQKPPERAPQAELREEKKTPLVSSPVFYIPKLQGLILLCDIKFLEASPSPFHGVRYVGLPLLERSSLSAQLAPFLGKPVTSQTLEEIGARIRAVYGKEGRVVAQIAVPEGQDTRQGILQMVVTEARVGKVKVVGARWTSQEDIKQKVSLAPDDPIRTKELLNELDWINRTSLCKVSATLVPTEEMGKTDIVLVAQDRFPVRFYGGYNDGGIPILGRDQYFGGFNWFNPSFGLDDQLNFQFTTNHDLGLRVYSGSYILPLPWHHILSIAGYEAEGGVVLDRNFSQNFKLWQVGPRYTIPLPKWGNYKQELTLGFDYKESTSNLFFGDFLVFGGPVALTEWSVTYAAGLPDPWGSTSLVLSGYYNPGDWVAHGDRASFLANRNQASPEFGYGRFTLERVTKLPWDFSLVLTETGQVASTNLIPLEQLVFGGFGSVRGYDPYTLPTPTRKFPNVAPLGDNGWIQNLEFRSPPISLGQLLGYPEAKDQLQFLGFWDYGIAMNTFLLPGERPDVTLSGVGPGIRYAIDPYINIRFDWGFQLYRVNRFEAPSRMDLGVVISY